MNATLFILFAPRDWAITAGNMTIDWPVLASIGSFSSAIFAGWQIYLTRVEARSRTTFEHLRDVTRRVQDIRHSPPTELCSKTRQAYLGKVPWDEDCNAYLALLDNLELLASARRLGIVDRSTVDEFLVTIVRRELVTLSAIADFRAAWNDSQIYPDLRELLLFFERKRRVNFH